MKQTPGGWDASGKSWKRRPRREMSGVTLWTACAPGGVVGIRERVKGLFLLGVIAKESAKKKSF